MDYVAPVLRGTKRAGLVIYGSCVLRDMARDDTPVEYRHLDQYVL